jgi:ribosomal protein S27AE
MDPGPMICPSCGIAMNRHAEKLVLVSAGDDGVPDTGLDGIVEELHACPGCGAGASRRGPAGR